MTNRIFVTKIGHRLFDQRVEAQHAFLANEYYYQVHRHYHDNFSGNFQQQKIFSQIKTQHNKMPNELYRKPIHRHAK